MQRTLENILGYRLLARDGEIGTVFDFFLDDSVWRLRYLVVETGSWLNRRRVLIAPIALGAIDGVKRAIAVNLTRDQVESSPGLDTDKPVSRQEETIDECSLWLAGRLGSGGGPGCRTCLYGIE
jgi:hypothetical protein